MPQQAFIWQPEWMLLQEYRGRSPRSTVVEANRQHRVSAHCTRGGKESGDNTVEIKKMPVKPLKTLALNVHFDGLVLGIF